MGRLITSGCSWTYGSSLPDTYPKQINPSIYAWPQVLGNLLNRSVINLAGGGYSNEVIFWKILNFEFEPDDICIIMWSFLHRYVLYEPDGPRKLHDYKRDHRLYTALHHDYDVAVRNCLTFHHSNMFLTNKNIRHYNLFSGEYNIFELMNSTKIYIDNIIDLDFVSYDFGFDGGHPGIKSHEILANNIYNIISNQE